MDDDVVLEPTAMVAGGDAIARDGRGRVVFVTGALPGERVRAVVSEERRHFARAVAVDVLAASPDRVAPPCPNVALGCGGCQWQHVAPAAQRRLKEQVVVDALRRIGRIAEPEVSPTVVPPPGGRTTVRMAVADGRPAYRRFHDHDLVGVDHCLALHPLLDELLHDARYDGAGEVTLRCGARTGERLVLASPSAAGVVVPAGVRVVGPGQRAWFHEEAAGRRWRISASSFFQARPAAADALVALVGAAIEVAGPARAADLYAGVGLFAATLAEAGAAVVAVEGDAGAVADARHNLRGLDARVVHADVARFTPAGYDVVVADPSRHGLGRRGVAVVARCRPERVVLVSCDAAALGRDARLLVDAGFALTSVSPVDLFPDTFHVEVVSVFDRAGVTGRDGA